MTPATPTARPDRMISASTIRETLASGVLVEDYPTDARGHGCLLLGRDEAGQPIHVVCAPKPDYLAVITAYRPDPAAWEADLRTRKRL